MLGGHGSFIDELAPRPPRIVLRSPVSDAARARAARRIAGAAAGDDRRSCSPARGGVEAFDARLRAIADEACAAVERGSALVILTDRGVDADGAAVPALLAQAAVHHALVDRGLRMRAEHRRRHRRRARRAPARRCCSATARRRCARRSATTRSPRSPAPIRPAATSRLTRYRLALERGLRTMMSKMGVCTFSGYCGAQLFEILGLDVASVDRFFPGTASPVGGATLGRHRRDGARAAPARVRRRRAGRRVSRPARLPPRRRISRDQPGDRARPAEGARRARRRRRRRRAGVRDLHVARLRPRRRRRFAICSSSRRRGRGGRRSTRSNRSRRSAGASSRRRCRSARCRRRRTHDRGRR